MHFGNCISVEFGRGTCIEKRDCDFYAVDKLMDVASKQQCFSRQRPDLVSTYKYILPMYIFLMFRTANTFPTTNQFSRSVEIFYCIYFKILHSPKRLLALSQLYDLITEKIATKQVDFSGERLINWHT